MIKPRFELSQTETTLTISIRAPYCSLRELETTIEENTFIFICKPYYLRLHLPGQILDNDNAHSKFDSESGSFAFTYDKTLPGEEFPDLDFITKLLAPKIEVNEGGRKIEILSSDTAPGESLEADVKYGFAMRGGHNFDRISSEFSDIFEIDPHAIQLEHRTAARERIENDDFNVDHYLADLLDGDEIREYTEQPFVIDPSDKFNADELDFLKDLNNVEYDLSENQIKYCHNSLLDILLSYCYERRTTFYEGTCESAWTICKLSASLSCFDGFLTPKDAIVSTFRRSLIYPLYREFNLTNRCFEDLKIVLKSGEKYLIKCLIEIYNIFLKGDGRYILNNLFIKDYIRYVMKWDKNGWSKIIDEVNKLVIAKSDLGLRLLEIEAGFAEVDIDLGGLSIKEAEYDSDDDSSADTQSDSDDTSIDDEGE